MNKKTVLILVVIVAIIVAGWYVYQNKTSLDATVAPVTTEQGAAVITAPDPLRASISGPTNVVIGQQVNYVVAVRGGTAPYNYTWAFPDATIIQGRVANWYVAAPTGAQSARVTVIDNKGVKTVASTPINISVK